MIRMPLKQITDCGGCGACCTEQAALPVSWYTGLSQFGDPKSLPPALLEELVKMGERMLAAPGGALRMMKRMIDEGYALSFSEGMALEARLGGPHNAAVTPEAVGARRDGVLERGRADAGGGKEAR